MSVPAQAGVFLAAIGFLAGAIAIGVPTVDATHVSGSCLFDHSTLYAAGCLVGDTAGNVVEAVKDAELPPWSIPPSVSGGAIPGTELPPLLP